MRLLLITFSFSSFFAVWSFDASAQVRTDTDCVYFFNDKGSKVRNGCANVRLIIRWHIVGGEGCMQKGWNPYDIIVDPGEVEPAGIGPNCLVDYWACDHAKWSEGRCQLEPAEAHDDDLDEAMLRRRKLEARNAEADKSRAALEAEEEARAAEAYRAQIDAEERAAKESEAQEEAAQILLNGLGVVLQVLSNTNAYTAAQDPPVTPAPSTGFAPPSGFTEPPDVQGSTSGRSYVPTPRYTGGERPSAGTVCTDTAPANGGGGPRCR